MTRFAQLTSFTRALGPWSTGDGTLQQRLERAVQSIIERDAWDTAHPLPPDRVLARTLGVSRTTVIGAYEALASRELIERRHGSGTYLRERRPVRSSAPRDLSSVRLAMQFPGGGDEASGALAVGSMPALDPWVRDALTRAQKSMGSHLRSHGMSPAGLLELRERIATYLSDGAMASRPEEVLVTGGSQMAIALVAQLYLKPGAVVLVEEPAYLGALDVFEQCGARLEGVPVTPQGIDQDALARAVERLRPQLIYFSSTGQNPTGAVMPLASRRRLARLLDQWQVPALEDLALAELVIDLDRPPPPVASFTTRAPIWIAGSVSKLFWSGLRIGWLRAHRSLIDTAARLRLISDMGSSPMQQLAAQFLIEDMDEARKQRRAELRKRRTLLQAELVRQLPTWRWQEPAAGMCLWVDTGEAHTHALTQIAARHGLMLLPGNTFCLGDGGHSHLRLAFGAVEPAIREAISRLGKAWHSYRGRSAQLHAAV
ncbi:MAG TPA: PLP-dependent aminotransferase family protein [Steroidobacteraceae bacterium]|nr:PLP-dependent aminotransferase family protein [Steroidobacteraceae bacterium]